MGSPILYDDLMINQTEMTFSLTLDMDQDILDEDYSPEFKKEYGIINMIPTGIEMGGYFEMEIIFDNEESKKKFIKDFDIDEILD